MFKLAINVFMLADLVLGVLAFYGAYFLRFEGNIPVQILSSFTSLWLCYIVVKVGVLRLGGFTTEYGSLQERGIYSSWWGRFLSPAW